MHALFVSFHAKDYAASKRFYEEVLGLEPVREHLGPPHRFTNYDVGGLFLKVYEWPDEYFGSGHCGLFIETDDLDSVISRLDEDGARHHGIRVHAWGGRSCSVVDPSGNSFDLIDSRQRGDV